MRKRATVTIAVVLSFIMGAGPILSMPLAPSERKVTSPTRVPIRPRTRALPRKPLRAHTSQQLQGQTSTPLPDGRLLLIGGETAQGPRATVAISDPRSGETLAIPLQLRRARAWHSATMLPDGKVLVAGGLDARGNVAKEAEILDPETNVSELLPPSALAPRAHHTATLLTDGRVLLVGGISDEGQTPAEAELWSPKTKTALPVEAKLANARQKHKATLLADGNVLIEGGVDGSSNEVLASELFSSKTRSFSDTALRSQQLDNDAPYVAASLPENGSADVPIDSLIALRFSAVMRSETVNKETITLIGPQGSLAAKIVPAEAGRLAFITPSEPLQPGTSYALSAANLTNAANERLGSTAITFTTAGKEKLETRNVSSTDQGEWKPNASNLGGNWRNKNKDTSWDALPALQAPPGVTALAGQVIRLNGKPLANVTLQIGDRTAVTDRTGRFLLLCNAVGHQVMKLDGRTANSGKTTYGTFKVGVELTANQTNVLNYTIWMPKLDLAHAVKISSPTSKDVIVTNPDIPGLELHLPRGTVIRDLDDRKVSEVSITPIPTNQPPFPLPPGVIVPVFFTIQPGGAQLIPPRARLIYPNFTNSRPGTRIDFWNYDATEKGWYVYGKGTVSANGKQIVPDPGVVLYEFSGAMVSNPTLDPADGPRPCNECEDGDPVDLGTGLFVYSKTDLVLPDVMPIALSRTYRPSDGYTLARPFGYGTTHPYEMFLIGDVVNNAFVNLELIRPDGGKIRYELVSGTESNPVFEHTATPSSYYKSKITSGNDGWELKLSDGTVYGFPIAIDPYVQQAAGLRSITDRHGNTVRLQRTDLGSGRKILQKIISPNGRWIEFTSDESDRITQARDNIGRTVSYEYDNEGRLWKVTDPEGQVTEYTYDSLSQMLTIKDARGIVFLTNEYDSNGRVTEQTQADGSTFLFDYEISNTTDRVVRTDVTDPRGYVRRVTFNDDGYWLTDTQALGEPEEQTTTYQRQSGTNLVTAEIDSLGRRTTYSYDSMGNVTSVTQLEGASGEVTTSFTYHPTLHKLASVTDPLNHVVSYSYDSQGNLTGFTDALDHESSFGYNPAGQPTSVTNALNHTTQLTYSGGDLVAATDPLGNTLSSYKDAAGRTTRFVDQLGHVGLLEYNKLNQPVRATDTLGGETTVTYDENGNVLTVTDARGGVVSYTYDNMDQPITRKDQLLHEDTYEYDLAGNIVKVTDRAGKITIYSYDSLNRLVFSGQDATGEGENTTYESTITYTYDAGDRLTEVEDSSSGTITLAYDDLDRLTSETNSLGVVTYSYDDAGRRTSMTVQGQSAVNYTYDDADRLTGITRGSVSVSFAYDDANRRTALTLPNGVVVESTYDDASRVTALAYKLGSTTLGDLTYAYDRAGRRIRMGGSYARLLLPQALGSSTYNAANQLTQRGSTSLTYDANGNLTSDGSNTYSWNARNQLVSVSGGVTASFEYDAFGRRTAKTTNSQTVQYLYDGSNVVQELTSGTPSANLLSGGIDEVFLRSDSAGDRSYLNDALGSSIALLDNSGVSQTTYTYEAFGKTTQSGSSGNASKFTGREDDGTGLYHYRARYYAPTLQRFISEDPTGFGGGDVNFYAYTGNDPINTVDPSGEIAPIVVFGAVVLILLYAKYANAPGPGDPIYNNDPAQEMVNDIPAMVVGGVIFGKLFGLAGRACGRLLRRTIDPKRVRFSQDSISPEFKNGGAIDDLAEGLRNGTVKPQDVPPIRLMRRDGELFTLDNRRLWAFQKAGVQVPYRMATPAEIAEEAWKFTTKNGGTCIRVREPKK